MTNKTLLSNSIIYFLFSALNQLLYLILIPLVAKNLSLSEYGHYSLVITVQSLFSMVITLGICSGFQRYYNETNDSNAFKNSIVTFSLISGSIVCIFIYLFRNYLGNFLFKGNLSAASFLVLSVLISWIQAVINVYIANYSIQFKAFRSSMVNFTRLVINVVLICFFLIILKKGILGILESTLLCNLMVLAYLFIKDIKNYSFSLKFKLIFLPLKFSLGLLPGALSGWILTLIDRFFIRDMIDINAVGVYSMGYKVGMLTEMGFVSPFSSGFTPIKYKIYNELGGKERIKEIYSIYNYLCCLFILLLSLNAELIIMILSTKEYLPAIYIVPIVAFSYYLWGIQMFNSLGLHIANKAFLNSSVVIISSIINITLNFILIPHLNIYGAALATLISYIIANIIYSICGQKYYNMSLNHFFSFIYLSIFSFLYLCHYLLRNIIDNLTLMFFIDLIICALYLVICPVFGLIKKTQITNILNKIKSRIPFYAKKTISY